MRKEHDTIIRILEIFFLVKAFLILIGIVLYLNGIPVPTIISFLFEDYQLYRLSILIPILMSIMYFYCAYGFANKINLSRILAIVITLPSLFIFPVGTVVGILIIGYLLHPRGSSYFDITPKNTPIRMLGAFVMAIGIIGVLMSIGIIAEFGESVSYFAGAGSLSALEKIEGDLSGSRTADVIVILSNRIGKSVQAQQSVLTQQQVMSQKIVTLGGLVTGSVNRVINAMRISIDKSELLQIASDPNVAGVIPVEKVIYIINADYYVYDQTFMLDNSHDVINADSLWDQGMSGKDIVVAVVDTGINEDMEYLQRNGESVVIDSYELYGDYVSTHGTACASCVSSQHPTYRGISPGCDLLDVEVFQSDGGATNWDILDGWNWVVKWKDRNNRFVICSNSFGGPGIDPTLNEAANNMVEVYNIPMAVAAGNVDQETGYEIINCPGSAEKVLTIGAVDDNGNIAFFSCHGPTLDGLDKPDVCAPGVNIYTFDPDGNLIMKSGTSFSTPITAGAMALIAENHQMHSAEQIQEAIRKGAVDKGAPGFDYYYGYGIVDLESSLMWIDGEVPAGAYTFLFITLPIMGLGITTYPEWRRKI